MVTYDYDAIVVGAGPAGSAAAYFLAKKGRRVLLVDKKSFPRDKLCSGGLSPRAMQCLGEMSVSDLVESRDFLKITGVRIFSPNGAKLEGCIPTRSSLRDYGYVVPRFSLDEILRAHAVKNGVAFKQMEVSRLALIGNACRGIITRETEITCDITVLATGANRSLLSKEGRAFAPTLTGLIYAVSARYENVAGLNQYIEIYYHKKLVPGYFWIFPESSSRANIGIGVWDSNESTSSLLCLYNEMVHSIADIKSRLRAAEVISPPRVWTIPFGRLDSPLGMDGLLVAGDAAGLANPFTGEGIYYALKSGQLAAAAAVQALHGHAGDAAKLYGDLCMDCFGQDLQVSHLLRKIFTAPETMDQLLSAANKDSELKKLVIGAVVNVIAKSELVEMLSGRMNFSWAEGSVYG